MGHVDLRIHGEPADVAKFKQYLLAMAHLLTSGGEIRGALQDYPCEFDILQTSKAYPDRGSSKLIREYIKIKFGPLG